MNAREIIVEELTKTLMLYEGRDGFEISIDIGIELKPLVEGIASNIVSRLSLELTKEV